jgi:hypothetical protein
MPLETSPLFSVSEHAAGVPNGKDSQVAADVRILNDTLLRFKAVGVDPAEFACLKAIVLFRSGEFAHLQNTKNVTVKVIKQWVLRCAGHAALTGKQKIRI